MYITHSIFNVLKILVQLEAIDVHLIKNTRK